MIIAGRYDITALIEWTKEQSRERAHMGADETFWCGQMMAVTAALSRLTTPPLPEEIAGLFDTVEEYLGDTENWELADDSTPDPTDAANSLHKLRATLRALAQERDKVRAEFAIAVKWHEQDEADYNELRDERDALAQENERLQSEEQGTPLGRLKAIADFAIAKGLCTGTEGPAPETFVLERIKELEAERDFFDDECKEHAATIAACVVERDEWKMKYESEVRLVDSIEAERDASRSETERLTNLCAEARADRDLWEKLARAKEGAADAIRAKTIEDAAQTAEWFINIEKFTARAVAARIRALAHTDESK